MDPYFILTDHLGFTDSRLRTRGVAVSCSCLALDYMRDDFIVVKGPNWHSYITKC